MENQIHRAIEDRLTKIRDVERINVVLTIILSLLALTSALLVAGLGRQMRLLAREAMRRRQEAEQIAADAQSARDAAEREERRAAFLAAAVQELASSLDLAHAVTTLAKLFVPNLAEICAIDLHDPDGTLRRVAVAHRDMARAAELSRTIDTIITDVPEALMRVMSEREVKAIGASSPIPVASNFYNPNVPKFDCCRHVSVPNTTM